MPATARVSDCLPAAVTYEPPSGTGRVAPTAASYGWLCGPGGCVVRAAASYGRRAPSVGFGGRRLSGAVAQRARSKSTEAYARSLDSRWVESICRIVPDFERMTSDWVVAVSAR